MSFVATLKRSFAPALATGAGIIVPPTLTTLATRQFGGSRLVSYAVNVGTVGLGFVLLRKMRGGRFVAPWVAGGMLQLIGKLALDFAPDIASRIGLAPIGAGGAALGGVEPAAYMGGVHPAGYMRGVERAAYMG